MTMMVEITETSKMKFAKRVEFSLYIVDMDKVQVTL